jgi:formamidopyrimidine-DNA glycosylase
MTSGGFNMLEIPESKAVSEQIKGTVAGKKISRVLANSSPHGFAFYFGDPKGYPDLLVGKTVADAYALARQIEMSAGNARILFSDGVNVRYFGPGEKLPEKHQLWIEFQDGSSLVCTVQMYGGLWVFPEGQNDNKYYLVAKEKPSPLSEAFDRAYFEQIWAETKPNLSVKAFLATEQRIPGLGNGTLQDILFHAGIHPKSKLKALAEPEKAGLFTSVKQTLAQMTKQGGRDTEKDLFGKNGGYPTVLSAKTMANPCPKCGGAILRQSYLGGNIYFCAVCQPVKEE